MPPVCPSAPTKLGCPATGQAGPPMARHASQATFVRLCPPLLWGLGLRPVSVAPQSHTASPLLLPPRPLLRGRSLVKSPPSMLGSLALCAYVSSFIAPRAPARGGGVRPQPSTPKNLSSSFFGGPLPSASAFGCLPVWPGLAVRALVPAWAVPAWPEL